MAVSVTRNGGMSGGGRGGEREAQAVRVRAPLMKGMSDETLKLCVNWNGMLEPLELPKHYTVAELGKAIRSARYAEPPHKLVVFKGLLLAPATTLTEAGIRDGAVLHLLLNDSPYKGKRIYIKNAFAGTRVVECGPDFYIADIKEELSYYPGELPAEKIRLVYAGRLLQDQHTLREYNIQKPSLLLALGPPEQGKHLSTFISSIYPRRDQCQVRGRSEITVRFHTAEVNNRHFFGQLLGPPDLSTLSAKDFKVYRCDLKDELILGELKISSSPDEDSFTWTPAQPFLPKSRYFAVLNQHLPSPSDESERDTRTFRHSRATEPVQGDVNWDFFTEGYEPLRITAVYPRPHSRVRYADVVLVLSFSAPLHALSQPANWVSVRGHELAPPLWDASTNSLVFKIAEPLRPNEIVRVSVRESLVRGHEGQSLLPLQQDGIIKTSAFRWKFYTSEESKYEQQNAFSSGVASVLERVRDNNLAPFAAQWQGGGSSLWAGMRMDGDAGRLLAAHASQRALSGEEPHAFNWLDPAGLLGMRFTPQISEGHTSAYAPSDSTHTASAHTASAHNTTASSTRYGIVRSRDSRKGQESENEWMF